MSEYKGFEKVTLIFLTAGEMPANNNIISSQVLKLSDYFYDKKLFEEIKYIGFVPVTTWLKAKLNKRLDFSFIEKKPYSTKLYTTFFKIGGIIEYLCKNVSIKRDINKITKQFNKNDKETIIFHCRSYYATFIAIKLKDKLQNRRIKIVFDMRSLLPPEFPLTMGKIGRYFYGDGKKWEFYLLNNSDAALMTTNKAINLLKIENPSANIKYIPITGLNNIIINYKEVFEERWNEKRISYIGSISPWHPIDSIERTFDFFEKYIDNTTFEIITNSKKVKTHIIVKNIAHNNIESYYNNLLALIIPGISTINDYFQRLKLSVNFFSTKAAEAISKGVPLIVNEDISELAEFVSNNKCGIVFRFKNGIELLNCKYDDLNSKSFWEQLSANMFTVSKNYAFTAVADSYINIYSSILTEEI